MKITYIHQHFKLPLEDGGSRPYEFARRMAQDGHSVTMLCGGAEALETEIDGILIKRLAVPYRNAMSIPERIWSFIRFSLKSAFEVSRIQSDVIYASSTPLTTAFPAIIGKIVKRVPMIFEVRDLWPLVPIELGFIKNPVAIFLSVQLEKAAYRCADRIVALSPGMKKGVVAVNPQKKVAVIPNACDFDLFNQDPDANEQLRLHHGWNKDEIVIIYAGGFGPTYNLNWVVEVAIHLRNENIKIALIGEGRDTPKLHELAERGGLDPKDLLLGRKPKSETVKYIQAADIVISSLDASPCLEVNSLNKVFDGLAAAKPILFNHDGWLKDAVVEAGAGWRVDRDPEQAARQIRILTRDRESLELMGERSAELGRTHFDRDHLYRQLINFILEEVEK